MKWKERNWWEKHQLYDLHSMNYGFQDGHVCIFDYACFERDNESDTEE